ncbi:MAG TPA: DUF2569 family protein [Bryobacteraceae bacterium]|jgi:Protein of unknown function (DUF2569)|nr:DUF2569 family protein [Bryobacteraceae bacterium]
MEASTALSDPRYQSVGGWLALFCLGLIVFTPLLTLNSLVDAHSSAVRLADRYPGFLITTLVDGVLSLALAAFSAYAGLGLWRIRPGAVRTAEIYLLCYLCYQGIAAVLPFMAGFPASANHALTEGVYKNLTRGLLYFGVWYGYLNKSRRVKATYSACRSLSAPDLP